MHAPVEWKLYDTCRVHHVTSKDKEIFMLVEKDYPLRKGRELVMISYKLKVENFSQMANDLVLKIYKIAKSQRQQDTMADMIAPTSQAPTMAPPVYTNDQILPRIRWVQTGYLKFSAKGTKREVFRMPIPGSLITTDLREALYYQEYLANVVKHRWFLARSVTSFGIVISFTDAFSASPSDKKLESHDTLEDMKDLSQPG
uniref:Histone deacetylase 14 n=1 Tax=Tanacetum cinerariifolium TaxID=118510 RepID=A0A6L2LKN1_TANCI|nr:hypothetical protein [Tanacetum cinerariifolium]